MWNSPPFCLAECEGRGMIHGFWTISKGPQTKILQVYTSIHRADESQTRDTFGYVFPADFLAKERLLAVQENMNFLLSTWRQRTSKDYWSKLNILKIPVTGLLFLTGVSVPKWLSTENMQGEQVGNEIRDRRDGLKGYLTKPQGCVCV